MVLQESKDEDLEKLLKSYSILDLNKPMLNCVPERKRHLLLEGDLKLKDSGTSKVFSYTSIKQHKIICSLLSDGSTLFFINRYVTNL